MRKHAVVIGGGHNGLVCAAYLAKAGVQVTVLERRAIVGGAAVTEEFHPGFRNSVASYTVSLLHPRIIEDLHLHAHGLQILPRRINNFLPLPDGRSLVSYPALADTVKDLAQFSAADAEQLGHYYASLAEVVPVVKDIMLMTPPHLLDLGFGDLFKLFSLSRVFRQLNDRQKRFLLKLFSVSAGEMLDDLFESDAIKALLGFDAIVGHFASPYSPGSAYVLLHHVVGEVNGTAGVWGHAVGGMGAITQAMAAEALAHGVTIKTEAEVSGIEIIKGRAQRVHLVDGSSLAADLVVANVNPKLLFCNLLDPADVDADILHHFQGYKCQSGTFRMNVALDQLPTFTARTIPGCLEGGIIMAPSLDYMDQAFTDARRHGWSAAPIVEMLLPSIIDPSLAPAGKHVASLFCQQFDPGLGAGWDQHREAVADMIINCVEGYAPGFRASILARQIHSPWDLEQKFGLLGGDIFHGRLSLDQLFSARPMLGMGQYQTQFDNLYLCGAGTHPGGGVSGLPGHHAARTIISHI
ncbi:MAG: NAD(P)/FAD-dependent oxidoreductase [Pseudomonadales bacterium]|jgi:phytoene dehydrogenase-like protein|nr:NAD(P)/FAD-dependent oxidoreductase [Pseudomonadales bacterium]MDP4639448.1 NAD(P)/FAD-dependent oxidoreductase [Pseudomonadales bacterium]MDP4764713.1 NAD(P)/FAD-dependent oxidoreductase [Pseudomonadales bacterium]MDP4876374.1 NAD(P)/FAD-dependent oxidoreductase [Pseudomonadales bacterium]MDP4911915.1 NAD(P)/FAD-dependent oxidoreductase [Pseudomonadales bacterium]